MSILSDADLRARHSDIIDLADADRQIQPSSVDVRLGTEIAIYARADRPLDARKGPGPADIRRLELKEGEGFIISPGLFFLAHTVETVRLPPDLTARIEGRSTLGRLGIAVHITAGYIDPGFEGQITLEMRNLNHRHVRLYAGDRVAQIVFETMTSPAERPYGERGKYQGQTGVMPALREKD